MVVTVLRAAEQVRTPWRNGGGSTREVVVHPAEASWAHFDWRISVADVTASGAFSSFAGVDRTIVLLDGPTMVLTVDGSEHPLSRHVPFAFDGGLPTSGAVADGPTRDLNVMTRRGRYRADVELLRPAAGVRLPAGDAVVVLPVEGTAVLAVPGVEPVHLETGDTLVDHHSSGGGLRSTGSVAVVRLHRVSPGAAPGHPPAG